MLQHDVISLVEASDIRIRQRDINEYECSFTCPNKNNKGISTATIILNGNIISVIKQILKLLNKS